MKRISGLAEVWDSYDSFILDQFGVLHDGATAYPGAAEAVVQLKQRSKTIVCLSNSGKSSAKNLERMARLGFDPDCIDLFLSSGEALRLMLQGSAQEQFNLAGRRAWILSRDADRSFMEGSDIEEAEDLEHADFMIVAGLPVGQEDIGFHKTKMDKALQRKLPLICANPDKLMIIGQQLAPAAGALAEEYSRMGGETIFVGKPHSQIYEMLWEMLGDQRRYLAVGDSIEHDIAGASQAGIDSLFIEDGIYRDRLADASNEDFFRIMAKECKWYGCREPLYTTANFRI